MSKKEDTNFSPHKIMADCEFILVRIALLLVLIKLWAEGLQAKWSHVMWFNLSLQ